MLRTRVGKAIAVCALVALLLASVVWGVRKARTYLHLMRCEAGLVEFIDPQESNATFIHNPSGLADRSV